MLRRLEMFVVMVGSYIRDENLPGNLWGWKTLQQASEIHVTTEFEEGKGSLPGKPTPPPHPLSEGQ